VRIERIRVDAFGRLTAFDTGPDPLESLVVVLGPNEAGKSTLFSFLTTALYGFQPASRERNPHVPWGADEAGGSVQITLSGAGCAEVERRLRSTPTGTLRVDGRTRPIRNQPVPWVEHLPRTVFRQVFAVTLSELAGLDDETWARIQDRVLGSMGATDLRPPRHVADELESEAGEIWRPNRRGHQRLRSLQDDIRALRARRSEALERDQQIRALVEEGENLQVRLSEVRAERQRDRVAVERVQELLPLKRQFDRIATLRIEGGAQEELVGLPEDPKARIEVLETEANQLGRQLAALDRALGAPRHALESFGEADEAFLLRGDEISSLLRRAGPADAHRARAAELKTEVVDLEYRARAAADQVLGEDLDQETEQAVLALSVDLLRDRIRRLHAASDARAARPSTQVAAGSSRGQLAAVVTAVTGLGSIAWAVLGGPQVLVTVGFTLLAVGLTLLIINRVSREAPATHVSEPGADGRALLVAEIEELLSGVPIRAEHLTPPGDPVVAGIERLQTAIQEWRERDRARQTATESLNEIDEEARRLGVSLGYGDTTDATDVVARIERELRDAERRRDAASGAGIEIGGLERERDLLSGTLDDVTSRLESLRTRLSRFGDGPGDAGLAVAQERVEAHLRADRIEAELDRTYPDVAGLKDRVDALDDHGPSERGVDDDLAQLRVRIEGFDRQIDELMGRTGAIEREAAHLREKETVDAVDGEVASLQETEARLITERDRKWVLAQLLREADRRFREEHQPDLLRRASSYLEHLTGGRYDRLLVDEQNDRDLFQIVGPGVPAPIALAPPISTGTLEQAYLSLRLAIVDHLDQGSERLPLFIDEVFVNWDAERRERGIEVLGSLASTRQVFAFTCHPEMAAQLAATGGRIVRLDPDE
jgi:uncharacterized protein YhaN